VSAAALIAAYYASLNERTPDALDALVTPAFRQHLPGHDADLQALQQFRTMYAAAFPDLQCIANTLSGGDAVTGSDMVTVATVTMGTHRGTFLGHAATNRTFRATGIDVFRIAGNRIAESWSEFDTFGMLRQLGITGAR
jgi:predicted ester cyclase